jgi:7-carboxy-7-deazaguanine synthase
MLFMKLSISEVFYSIQGEGKTSGVPAVFVRLGGCNLMCGGMGTQFDNELHNGASWRCDTIEVWMKAKSKSYDEILPEDCQKALRMGSHLVITGGEPLIQSSGVEGFIKYCREQFNQNLFVEIETNGTITPSNELTELVSLWNCSPKLYNSGNDKALRFNMAALESLDKLNTQFKFVITTIDDFEEVKMDFGFLTKSKFVLMPSGENQELLAQSKQVVVELCKEYYINFTSRLHIDIWNKKTGV